MWTNPLIRVWSHNQQKLGIVHVVMANTSLRLFVWLVCGFVFFVFWLHLKSCIHTAWISCCIIYCTSNFILLFWWEMAPNLWDPNMKRSNAKCQLVFFSRRYFILGWRASMRVYIYWHVHLHTSNYTLLFDRGWSDSSSKPKQHWQASWRLTAPKQLRALATPSRGVQLLDWLCCR